MAWALGDLVACTHDDGRQIGVVVGLNASMAGMLHEVSLEDVIVKGLLADELTPVSPAEVRSLIGQLAQMPDFEGGAQHARRAVLRTSYAHELGAALDRAEGMAGDADGMPEPTFVVGEHVALREGEAWLLGAVLGVRSRADVVEYVLDVMGEMSQASQDDLLAIDQVPVNDNAIGLGTRVRFLASGYEDDEGFLGRICMVQAGDEPTYAIAFDDGDILEDLTAADLTIVSE